MKNLIAILSIGFIALAAVPTASAHDHAKKCCGTDGKCCAEQAECCGTDGKCCSKKAGGPIKGLLGLVGKILSPITNCCPKKKACGTGGECCGTGGECCSG